jgi:hypothetical protein
LKIFSPQVQWIVGRAVGTWSYDGYYQRVKES